MFIGRKKQKNSVKFLGIEVDKHIDWKLTKILIAQKIIILF